MQLKTLMLGFSALGLLLVITTTGCGNDQGHTHTSVNQETAKLNARICESGTLPLIFFFHRTL